MDPQGRGELVRKLKQHTKPIIGLGKRNKKPHLIKEKCYFRPYFTEKKMGREEGGGGEGRGEDPFVSFHIRLNCASSTMNAPSFSSYHLPFGGFLQQTLNSHSTREIRELVYFKPHHKHYNKLHCNNTRQLGSSDIKRETTLHYDGPQWHLKPVASSRNIEGPANKQ